MEEAHHTDSYEGSKGMAKTAEKRQGTQRQETHAGDGAGLHLHMRTLHPSVPVPYLTKEEMTGTA